MSDFTIHGVLGSPFMRAVMVAMEEKNAPYRIQAMAPGDSSAEAYRAMNPFGRIPTITHGDFTLYETQAILRYIDAVFPGPSLQPREPKALARMNQMIGINDWYLFPQCVRIIVFQRIVAPALLNMKPDEAACAAAMDDTARCIGEVNRLLGDAPYLAGDVFTLADVHLAPQLYYFAMTPEGASVMKNTAVARWLDRVSERPSMQRTLPPEALRKAA
jgi:glutathione S-transferase